MKPPPAKTRFLLYTVLALIAILRVDLWLWTDPARVLGLPVGMTYHAVYCLAVAVCMWLLVRHAWPDHLRLDGKDDSERTESAE